jgi:hypothetical protein
MRTLPTLQALHPGPNLVSLVRVLCGILSLVLALDCRLHAADPAWVPPVQRVTGWLESGQNQAPTVRTELELVAQGKAPLGFTNLRTSLTLRIPDRLHLAAGTNRTRVEFGRMGDQTWLWEAASRRWSRLRLPTGSSPMGFPAAGSLLGVAAKGCETTAFPPVRIEGESCAPFRIRPGGLARDYLGSSDFTLTLWINQTARLPLATRWQDPAAGIDLTAWLRRVRVERSTAEAGWSMRPPTGARVEDVTLETLQRRLPAGFSFLAIELSALPAPAPTPR